MESNHSFEKLLDQMAELILFLEKNMGKAPSDIIDSPEVNYQIIQMKNDLSKLKEVTDQVDALTQSSNDKISKSLKDLSDLNLMSRQIRELVELEPSIQITTKKLSRNEEEEVLGEIQMPEAAKRLIEKAKRLEESAKRLNEKLNPGASAIQEFEEKKESQTAEIPDEESLDETTYRKRRRRKFKGLDGV